MASAPIRAPLRKDAIDQACELRNDLADRIKGAILEYERLTGCTVDAIRLNRPERPDYSTGAKRARLFVELKVILGRGKLEDLGQ
jgi:hypothetical protein